MLGLFMTSKREAHLVAGKPISRAQLARALGVTRATLHNWESGHRHPTPEHLGAWARVLGLTSAQRLRAYDLLADSKTAKGAA